MKNQTILSALSLFAMLMVGCSTDHSQDLPPLQGLYRVTAVDVPGGTCTTDHGLAAALGADYAPAHIEVKGNQVTITSASGTVLEVAQLAATSGEKIPVRLQDGKSAEFLTSATGVHTFLVDGWAYTLVSEKTAYIAGR